MMKLITLLILSASIYAAPKVATTIAPIAFLIDEITHEKTKIFIPPNSNPHNFDPKPSHLIELSKADLYFTLSLPVEKIWIKKLQSIHPNLRIINLYKEDTEHDEHTHEHHNPHIWTSPLALMQLTRKITTALCQVDATKCAFYKTNSATLLAKIEQTKKSIQKSLQKMPPHRTFVVYHPTFGLFAKEFDLIQLPIEREGKEPSLKALQRIAQKITSLGVTTIITQPQIPSKSVSVLASMLHLKKIEVSSLSYKILDALEKLAKSIVDADK